MTWMWDTRPMEGGCWCNDEPKEVQASSQRRGSHWWERLSSQPMTWMWDTRPMEGGCWCNGILLFILHEGSFEWLFINLPYEVGALKLAQG